MRPAANFSNTQKFQQNTQKFQQNTQKFQQNTQKSQQMARKWLFYRPTGFFIILFHWGPVG